MKNRWFLCGTGILFAADQILKSYIEQNLDKGEEKDLAGPIVLRRVSNTGMCLNFLSGSPGIVRAFSLAAAGFVSIFYMLALFCKKGFWKKTALSLMTAGHGAIHLTALPEVMSQTISVLNRAVKNCPL